MTDDLATRIASSDFGRLMPDRARAIMDDSIPRSDPTTLSSFTEFLTFKNVTNNPVEVWEEIQSENESGILPGLTKRVIAPGETVKWLGPVRGRVIGICS